MQEEVPWILALTDVQQRLALHMKNCQQRTVRARLRFFFFSNNPLTRLLEGLFHGSVFVTLNAKKYLKRSSLLKLPIYSVSPQIL